MIALALTYCGLATIGGAVLTAHRLRVIARALVVVVVPVLAFAVWRAAQPPTGWPATGSPPKGQFVSSYVTEPDALTHNPGEIELWLVPSGSARPRSYRLPYSRRLHQQVAAASSAAKAGVKVGIKRVSAGKVQNGPKAKFRFYVLPPPRPPSKG